MKEYTADDCIKNTQADHNSKSFYFEHDADDTKMHKVTIESITLQLSEEIEKQGGGPVEEFAAEMLNNHLKGIKHTADVHGFFEEIST